MMQMNDVFNGLFLFFKALFRLILFVSLLITGLFVLTENLYAEKEKIIISGPPFPPYNHANGRMTGSVGRDLCNLIFDRSTIDFELKFFPYTRMLHNVKYGVIDIAFCFKNENLKGHVDYIGPISKLKIVVITKKPNEVKKYADLKYLNGIGMIRSAQYFPRFDNDSSLKKVGEENYNQVIRMLYSDQVEAVIGSYLGLKYAFNSLNIPSDIVNHGFTISEKEVWLHFSKKSNFQNTKNYFESKVKELYKANLLQEIYQKYDKPFSQSPVKE